MADLFERPLFVGAHVDDPELFAGGTIARFAQWAAVVYFSRHKGIRESPGKEVAASIEVLRVGKYECLDLPACQSGEMSFHARRGEICSKLETWRDSFCPTVVVTHQSSDTNQDHQQVYREVMRVFRKTPILLGSFAHNDWPRVDRRFFVMLSADHVARKIRAVEAYESQRDPRRTYLGRDEIMEEARFYGGLVGAEYAEAFEVIRVVV